MNHFQRSPERPQHISVGAIMRDANGRIRVHHFPAAVASRYVSASDPTDLYILMRETIEPNESLEAVLMRGLREEFNAIASLEAYIGSIVADWEEDGTMYQKTTLYFSCVYERDASAERDRTDAESQSELVWMTAEELIPLMKAQRERFGRGDLDESSILERYIAQRA